MVNEQDSRLSIDILLDDSLLQRSKDSTCQDCLGLNRTSCQEEETEVGLALRALEGFFQHLGRQSDGGISRSLL